MESILAPLFQSLADVIEGIILSMHKEDYNLENYQTKKHSPFIREMDTFIKRVIRDHFRWVELYSSVDDKAKVK